MMEEQRDCSAEDRAKAAELYARALELQAQKDYRGARACFQESLALYEDEEVFAAYRHLMSAIGPD